MSSLLAEPDNVTAVVGRATPAGGGSGTVGCTPQRLEELVRWNALYVVSAAS
jgi:hypothetical protein